VSACVAGCSPRSKSKGTPLITAPEWFLHATPAIEAMIEFGRQAGALAAENMSRTI
jgi:hypothetical protein